MGLLLYSNTLPLTTASSRSSSPFPTSSSSTAATAIFSRLRLKSIDAHPKSFSGVHLCMPSVKRFASVVVKTSSDIDGFSPTESSEPVKEVVPVHKLPLESKLQKRLEQKAKMQLEKKIRLQRKRLVHKRRLRKKGRWPPSKMKKLKNV